MPEEARDIVIGIEVKRKEKPQAYGGLWFRLLCGAEFKEFVFCASVDQQNCFSWNDDQCCLKEHWGKLQANEE